MQPRSAASGDGPRPVWGDDLQQQSVHRFGTGSGDGSGDGEASEFDDDTDLDDDLDAAAEVDEGEVAEHAPERDRAHIEQLAQKVRRHAADREAFAQVSADGFEGKRWNQLTDDLIRYGWAVMAAWLATGYIYVKVNQIGRPLTPTDTELAELHSDCELREELCAETVARAVKTFRDLAVAGTGWSPEGGASLTTFFVGTCVQAFNNEFRRWSRHERRWSPNHSADPHSLTEFGGRLAEVRRGPHIFAEPAHAAAETDHFDRVLAELTDTEQAILRFTDAGFSQREIGELLGLTERAVEARLYRLRNRDIRARLQRSDDV